MQFIMICHEIAVLLCIRLSDFTANSALERSAPVQSTELHIILDTLILQ